MRSTRQDKRDWKLAALSAGPLFTGCGVTLLLFKQMPHEFGPSGTLIAPGVVVVSGILVTATTLAAVIDRLAIKLTCLAIDFFLMGLLFALYLLSPRSPDRWLFLGIPMAGVPLIYLVITFLAVRFKALCSRQQSGS